MTCQNLADLSSAFTTRPFAAEQSHSWRGDWGPRNREYTMADCARARRRGSRGPAREAARTRNPTGIGGAAEADHAKCRAAMRSWPIGAPASWGPRTADRRRRRARRATEDGMRDSDNRQMPWSYVLPALDRDGLTRAALLPAERHHVVPGVRSHLPCRGGATASEARGDRRGAP